VSTTNKKGTHPTSNHSPEPWTVKYERSLPRAYHWFRIEDANGSLVVDQSFPSDTSEPLANKIEATFERIVACVNACADTIDASGPLVRPTSKCCEIKDVVAAVREFLDSMSACGFGDQALADFSPTLLSGMRELGRLVGRGIRGDERGIRMRVRSTESPVSPPKSACCAECRFYSDETEPTRQICMRFPKHETTWRTKYCGEFKEIIKP